MAIIGGAGNPIGGAFTGPALALEYIGDHCYAYSGVISVDNSTTTLLNFTTGSNYALVDLTIHQGTGANVSNDYLFALLLNGVEVMTDRTDDGKQDYSNSPFRLILAPYTEVKLTAANVTGSDSNDKSAIMTGRVYRDTGP